MYDPELIAVVDLMPVLDLDDPVQARGLLRGDHRGPQP